MDYRTVFTIKRLWLMFGLSLAASFAVLLAVGGRLYQESPPMPRAVVDADGRTLFDGQTIQRGMDVWRLLGGMQLGSVWGHGGYLAPDWTADQLHRESLAMLNRRAGGEYERLGEGERAALRAELGAEMRRNTWRPETGVITVGAERAAAMRETMAYYANLFGAETGAPFEALREAYAIPRIPFGTPLPREDLNALAAFFWWTAWAATATRPGGDSSYTSNWPFEPLIDNGPTADAFLWTFVSIVLLIAGIGWLAWFFNRQRDVWQREQVPVQGYGAHNPLDDDRPTPSMHATRKFFYLVAVLLGLQIFLGAVTAHYAVEGQHFYGLPLAQYVPYALTRTWHTQLAITWIAVAWLAAGLYIVPLLARREPRGQCALVNLLWAALVVVTVGSMAGEWAAVQGHISDPVINFWVGHQGYEYLDLGRLWQILLFAGLLFWVFLMGRGLLPAIRNRHGDTTLLTLLLLATASVGLLYGAGLFWGRTTALTIAEYWRWWVVHLWVEGVFEVFATAWIAWIFVYLRLLNPHSAAIYAMFSAMIFLGGGVLGTFHHLYFSGTPPVVLALGAVFSALEVVPLALIAFDAYDHWRIERHAPWMQRYHMPLLFFLAVAFWNLFGAGVLGFLINPPLALYYMQGLMLTPTHGHAALFGVYGMLGIGLLLFCMRGLELTNPGWSDAMVRWVFWLFNGGLALMVCCSLLPQGLMQAHRAFSDGYWHARSAEFMHSFWMETLVWIRVPGDVVFGLGAVLLLLFLGRLWLAARRDDARRGEAVRAG